MDEDIHKSNLYRWKRQCKPKVLSKSHHVKTTDDIATWIKKVEAASDRAADVAFGLVPSGKQKGKALVQQMAGQVRDTEQAYNEAKDLLTQWMNEKVRFDDDDGFDDLEAWRRARKNKYDIFNKQEEKNESDELSIERLTRLALEDEFEIDEAAIYERVKRNAVGDSDPYANLYKMEEDEAVKSVLKTMMSKEMVKDIFKKDLGLYEEAKPDPRTKMELRHKMVKENREKREKEFQKRKSEAQIKKEARLEAQQLLLKEQKDREMRARKEEMELKKDMAKIRKDMYEERRKKEEEMRRTREAEEMLNKMAREELARQRAVEDSNTILTHRLENERRHQQIIKMEMIKKRIASRNLQCLHQHFTAWYDLVLSRRLLLGKIKAMSDWKLMLKIWGAWRSHVRGQRLDIEVEKHEREIIDAQRKTLRAERHWAVSTLRKCFISWQLFTKESLEKKDLEKEQDRTKRKMASLLNAIADGKIVKTDEEENEKELKNKRHKNGPGTSSARSEVNFKEPMLDPPVRRQAWGDNESVSASSSQTPVNPLKSTSERFLPSEPWQVTHRHLKIIKKATPKPGHREIDEPREKTTEQQAHADTEQPTHTDKEIRKRLGTQPWMNRHFVVNNLEHRYTAQQQALREQQDQIREQLQLIQELQYEQRQQALKQQLLLGNTQPPLPPLEEVEVPPQGREIPRGDEETEAGSFKGLHRSQVTTGHDNLQSKKVGQIEITAKQNQADLETERSKISTGRSEVSSATTHMSKASSSTVNVHNTKYLQVLKNMEDRAGERARKKAERDEKRRKQEEEKLAELQKIEQEKLLEIEAEKKARAAAYRQKKLMEKQKEEDKRKEQAHMDEMNKKADLHYLRSILKYRGLLPFKKLISLAKRNWLKAVKHREKIVMRQCLEAWKLFTEQEVDRKNKLADQTHEFLITKHCFQNWRNYKYHTQLMERRAERHYQDNLKTKFFQAWTDVVADERINSMNKMELGHSYYLRSLIKKTFLGWRYLKERQKKEEERHKRKVELRKKVSEIIPDFAPKEDVSFKQSEDLES
ncbi:unnamed protein product [Lymnaea stagnalis]|uniref:Uncharacterized protein n=1 Tax=Lymnaea stagnalis TaxID=6523 RepID=A0AAV2HF96_LYMST